MRTWTRTIGAASAFILSAACTVTVGSGVDDSDDLDFTDKTEDPETSEGDSSETNAPSDATSTEPAGETSTSEDPASTSEAQTSSSPVSSSTGDAMSTSGETDTSDPTPIACAEEPAPGSCEECVSYSCASEWQACCAAEGCVSTWIALYGCMVNNPTDDPLADFDFCAESVSESGDQLDLPDEVVALASCVNLEFMGDPNNDPFDRQEGDGTCTLACYNWETLFPME